MERVLHPRLTHVRLPGLEPGSTYNQVLDELCASSARNEMIASDVAQALSEGRTPLVLTRRKEHARTLCELLEARGCSAHLLIGEGTAAERRRRLSEALAAMDTGPAALVATDSLLGEGFNAARLDTLFLATPVSWAGKLTQEVGRLHRGGARKGSVIVYDYVDTTVPMLARMYRRRLKTYAALGYKVVQGSDVHTPDGSFVGSEDFARLFLADVAASTRSIRIAAPYASARGCEAVVPGLADAVARGVHVECMLVREPRKTALAMLRKAGVALAVDGRVRPLGLATFDDAVVWYGDLPLLAVPDEDGCDVRVASAEAAHDLAEAMFHEGVEGD